MECGERTNSCRTPRISTLVRSANCCVRLSATGRCGPCLLARSQQITVPKIIGLVRPTILLPAAAVIGLSTSELEMVLAHELAHIRRHDMWVNLLQRLAEAVLFFNPALWYLSRRTSSLREFCCDELTCGELTKSGEETRTRYARALLKVVEVSIRTAANRSKGRLHESSELASLAASGKSPSELRRRVAHLFGEELREPIRLTPAGYSRLWP